MGSIYKITNKINNKIYIGKTTREPKVRWLEHQKDSQKEVNKTIPLYNAFNKYGINNFTFSIIETNINNELLDEKEKYYINFYNSTSHANGYNITLGGNGGRTSSKLTEKEIDEIVKLLMDKNNFESFNDIAKKYNIDKSVINRINNGESWYNKNLHYPIRKYSTAGITISREKYSNIVKDIQNNMPFKKIQNIYNISENQLTSINNGYNCYNNNKDSYYYGIYLEDFPIRTTNKAININFFIIDIFYDILFTKLSMEKIGIKYNIKGNTLTYIANGKRQKDLTKNFITPMRKNLEKNQEIFKQLYPNYERRDN